MRVFVIFAILTSGLACCVQSHDVVPIPFSRILPRDGTCTAGKETCSADCRSIVYCNADGQEELTNCLASTGKPYCEKLGDKGAQCSTNADSCIKPTDICPVDGIFPNLLDCRKYVFCIAGAATNAVCDANKVFHGGKKMCLPGTTCYNYDSVKGSCKGRDQVRLAYPLDKKLYVYCSSAGPKLRVCPATEHIEFDPKQAACVFVCSKQGLFKDENDPHYYYECAPGNGGLQATRRKCPGDAVFDENKEQCTTGSNQG